MKKTVSERMEDYGIEDQYMDIYLTISMRDIQPKFYGSFFDSTPADFNKKKTTEEVENEVLGEYVFKRFERAANGVKFQKSESSWDGYFGANKRIYGKTKSR